MNTGGKNDTKVYTDCNRFWRVGNKIRNIWSTRYDGSTADEVNGYGLGTPPLKPGDLVSKSYTAMGGT